MPVILKEVLPLKVPLRVWIDPTNVCNFKCTFCPTADEDLLKSVNRPKGQMKMETYKKVIDELEAMVIKYKSKPIQISLYKDGESLLNKNLPEMIKMLREKNITDCVEITSNGSALNEKNSRDILSAGLQRIRFSIEHVTDEGYEKVTQKKVKFNKIYENIKRFYEINKSLGNPCIIHVKILNFNLRDEHISKFKKLFKPISTSIEINYPHGWSDSEKKDFKLGTKINKSTGGGSLSKRKICPEPFSRLTITHNGDALPCCVDWSHKLKVGNIKNSNLDKIWNGVEANKVRLYHLQNKIPKDSPCFSCSYMQGHPEYETIDGIESKLIEDYSK